MGITQLNGCDIRFGIRPKRVRSFRPLSTSSHHARTPHGFELALDQTDPDNRVRTVVIPPENFYADINQNSIETDGKINVKINEADQTRLVIDPEQIGDWWYTIGQNETFTCDIFVDPERIVTVIPE